MRSEAAEGPNFADHFRSEQWFGRRRIRRGRIVMVRSPTSPPLLLGRVKDCGLKQGLDGYHTPGLRRVVSMDGECNFPKSPPSDPCIALPMEIFDQVLPKPLKARIFGGHSVVRRVPARPLVLLLLLLLLSCKKSQEISPSTEEGTRAMCVQERRTMKRRRFSMVDPHYPQHKNHIQL